MRVSTDKKAARGVVLLLGIAALVAVSGCSGRAAPVGGAPQGVIVVAGENFWGDIASQIGGSRVKVTSIISDPSTVDISTSRAPPMPLPSLKRRS